MPPSDGEAGGDSLWRFLVGPKELGGRELVELAGRVRQGIALVVLVRVRQALAESIEIRHDQASLALWAAALCRFRPQRGSPRPESAFNPAD